MDDINVLIYYDGIWEDYCYYKGYSVVGIVIPIDCNYVVLVDLIMKELKRDPAHYDVTIQYQIVANGPIIRISGDSSVSFYKGIKKNESNPMKFPLCVDINLIPGNYDDGMALDTVLAAPNTLDSTLNMRAKCFDKESINISLSHKMLTIEEMGLEISQHVTCNDEIMKESDSSVVCQPSIESIKVNTIFKNKELLTTSLALHAIHYRYQFRVYKSDKSEYVLKCVDENCEWEIRCSIIGRSAMFKIRKVKTNHTCSLDIVLGDHRQATCSMIASCIKYKFTSARTVYTPADVVRDMMNTYGVSISYDKAWRARERALELVRGDPEKSYRSLPSHFFMIEQSNEGSYTRIETDECDRLMFSFVAIGASIEGWKYCKPIIVVDGTFLTGSYGGTLFTACTQDANNNIFILAFGVGDSENNLSWEWFLLRLKEAYGERDGLVIISDRHGSIENAILKVYPNAMHGVCCYHLYQNLKKQFSKKAKFIRQPFNAAARAYTKSEFETQMRHLDNIDKDIRGYLERVGYHKWTRAYMTSNRFNTMTSNIVESVNSVTRSAKNFPIEALFESLRCTVQRWFFKNLNDARSTFTRLGSRYEKMVRERSRESIRMGVVPSSESTYQVNDETSSFLVRMDDKTCSCNRFQMDEIPCSHAIAVIGRNNLSVYDYCSPYFSKESYVGAYMGTVYPLGNKSDWSIPNDVENMVVNAPLSKRTSGRPREKRFRSVCESKKRLKCGRCMEYGHNRTNCKNPPRAPLKESKKRKANHD